MCCFNTLILQQFHCIRKRILIGPWKNVITDLDYIQEPFSRHGLSSSNISYEVLNFNVAHNIQFYSGIGREMTLDNGRRVYTDEEERAPSINIH
jgi:hypothetical protein